ncbi:C2 domain-containing protein [Mycotypha africana]|uniref:C2 domain-containing protein n=1 Tax=Mycotypha africana TaxID=64632 RepID=UPI0023014AA9|nr:C2 domain-containing protein [Mycotypha africana]KAI8987237.1 C2 domain-containing protein [Mycotypha africana]
MSLSIHVIAAAGLKDVETMGKQDPYVQCSLDFNNKEAYLKTSTKKNAGQEATWNEAFSVAYNGESDLYVEILDEEHAVDEVIAFAAIPLDQVHNAPGGKLNGIFDVYNTKGDAAGKIHLQLSTQGTGSFDDKPVDARSYVNDEHKAHMKSTNRKAAAVSAGGTVLGAGLAIAAGLLGQRLQQKNAEQQ